MQTIASTLKSRQASLILRQGGKITIWPSLDFSLGCVCPARKDERKASATEFNQDEYWSGYKTVSHITADTDQAAIDRYIARHHAGPLEDDLRAALFDALEAEGRYDAAIQLSESAAIAGNPPMGLSPVVISHNRKRRGMKGITTRGKRLVRSCATILEDTHGRRQLTLLTLTIPDDLNRDEFTQVCRSWAELTRKFWQQVGRLLERRGLPKNYVFVNEIQEKRFARTGRVGLHCHGLYVGRLKGKHWAISHTEIRELWERLLSNCIGRAVIAPAATRVESIRKSCKAELGKYISKGCTIINAVIESGQGDLIPSAWYGASRELKAEVKAGIQIQTDGFSDWIHRYRWALQQKGILYYKESTMKLRYTNDFGQTWIEVDKIAGIAGRFTSTETLVQARKWFTEGVKFDFYVTQCDTQCKTV